MRIKPRVELPPKVLQGIDPLIREQRIKEGKITQDDPSAFTLKPSKYLFKHCTAFEVTEKSAALDGGQKKFLVKKFDSIVLYDNYYAKYPERETCMLNHFHNHRNIVSLENTYGNRDLYLLMTDYSDHTLNDVFRSPHALVESQMTYIVYQILCALSYIHRARVVHRDVIPENILLSIACHVKLSDFANAHPIGQREDPDVAEDEYGGRLPYLAPEVLGGTVNYDNKADVWSLGCIIAQMYNKTPGGCYQPLFRGRINTRFNQLGAIIDFIGTPAAADMSAVMANDLQNQLREEHNNIPPTNFNQTLHQPNGGQATPALILLVQQMLMFNPANRISVDNGMQSTWLATHFDPHDLLLPEALPFTAAYA